MGTKTRFMYLIIIIAISIPAAFADGFDGILINTDKESYETGDTLEISGKIEERKMPILALRIFAPDGSILTANNVELEDDNSFSKTVFLNSPFYEEPGNYVIKIDYGKLDKETTFEIVSNEIVEDSIEEEIIPELTNLITDKPVYTDNETITISGSVSAIDDATVLVGIYDPIGVPTGFYFGELNSNNEFSVSFLAKAGVNFKIDGTYTALAHYGESKSEVSFDFSESLQNDIEDDIEDALEIIEEIEETIEIIEDEVEETPEITHDDETIVDEPKSINEKVETTQQTEIIKEETKPKQKDTVEQETKTPSIIDNVPITKNTSKNEKKLPMVETEKKPTKADNLSVEDIELGILLNQITLNCDQSEHSDIVSYYDGMGPAMIRLCKYSEAIHFFDKELSKNSTNVESLTNKGTALAKLGHFEEAIIHFDHALDIDSSFVPALNNKGNALSKLGKFDEAIQSYNVARNLQPENEILNQNLATALSKLTPSEKQKQQIEPPIQNSKSEKNENFKERKPQNDSTSDFFEQIGNVFSSLRSVFGFT